MSSFCRAVLFCLFAIPISIIDIRTHRISGRLLGLLMGTLTIFDSLYNRERVVVQLITAVGVWLLFGCFFEWCGGLGLGDVKYAGVIGYMLGPELVIAGLLSGTVLALGFWTAGKLAGRWGRGKRIAFGPWLSLGAIVVQVLSGWGCMA